MVNLRNAAESQGDARQLQKTAVDEVTGLPRGGKLCLVMVQTAKAKKKIEFSSHGVDGALFHCGVLVLAKSGHRGHAQAHPFISSLLGVLKEIDKKVIHDAIGSVCASAHEVTGNLVIVD